MPVLLEDTQKQVEQLLVKNGLIEKAQLDAVHAKAKEKGEPFFQLLVTEEHVTGEELTKVTSG